MSPKEHWDKVYSSKTTDRLGWYKPRLDPSLGWIKSLALDREDPIIDVGGGVSTLVDELLKTGYQSVTVLDISKQALSLLKSRLLDDSERVEWVSGDITSLELPAGFYGLWHDRAVFHFLTTADSQQKYVQSLVRSLKPGGYLIIGTFAPQAPAKCSGLPVQRYTVESLQDTLGEMFELKRHHKEMHITPGGVEQMYLYCLFRRNQDG